MLKLATWDVFFDEVLAHCKKHLPDCPDYFGSLANLVVTRLVKSVPISKPINVETTGFLRSFLDGLAKHASATGSGMEHEETLLDLASMLNFGAAPGPRVCSEPNGLIKQGGPNSQIGPKLIKPTPWAHVQLLFVVVSNCLLVTSHHILF